MSQLKYVLIGLRGRGGKLNWDNVLKSASFFLWSHPLIKTTDILIRGRKRLGVNAILVILRSVGNWDQRTVLFATTCVLVFMFVMIGTGPRVLTELN